MPMMPKRPSKKAQRIAESLNPLTQKVMKKKREISRKNEILMQRDYQLNFRTPEPSV